METHGVVSPSGMAEGTEVLRAILEDPEGELDKELDELDIWTPLPSAEGSVKLLREPSVGVTALRPEDGLEAAGLLGANPIGQNPDTGSVPQVSTLKAITNGKAKARKLDIWDGLEEFRPGLQSHQKSFRIKKEANLKFELADFF